MPGDLAVPWLQHFASHGNLGSPLAEDRGSHPVLAPPFEAPFMFSLAQAAGCCTINRCRHTAMWPQGHLLVARWCQITKFFVNVSILRKNISGLGV